MEVYEVLFIRTSKQMFFDTLSVAYATFTENNKFGVPCLMLRHEVTDTVVAALLNGNNFAPPKSHVWVQTKQTWEQVHPVEE